jgi:hypothetical protein
MNEEDYRSEDATETNALLENICIPYMDSITNQDTEILEQYPKVRSGRRVIGRVQIKSD